MLPMIRTAARSRGRCAEGSAMRGRVESSRTALAQGARPRVRRGGRSFPVLAAMLAGIALAVGPFQVPGAQRVVAADGAGFVTGRAHIALSATGTGKNRTIDLELWPDGGGGWSPLGDFGVLYRQLGNAANPTSPEHLGSLGGLLHVEAVGPVPGI